MSAASTAVMGYVIYIKYKTGGIIIIAITCVVWNKILAVISLRKRLFW